MFHKIPEKSGTLTRPQVEKLQLLVNEYMGGVQEQTAILIKANFSLKSLSECNAQLIRCSALLGDNERMQKVKEALVLAYLDLSVDETKKTIFGGTSKGKTLQFVENLLSIYFTSADLFLQSCIKSPEICKKVADHFFDRAIAEIFLKKKNDEGADLFAKLTRTVVSMGDVAVTQWNNRVTQSSNKLAKNLFNLNIDTDIAKQESDYAQRYKNLSEDEQREISKSYASEILLQLFTCKVYDLEAACSSPRLKSNEKLYWVTQSNKFNNIMKKLTALFTQKNQDNFMPEMYKAVIRLYFDAYIADRTKAAGATGKGAFLKTVENLLLEFQETTGSNLFYGNVTGNKAKNNDSIIFSSIALQSAETRDEVVRYAFNNALQQGFKRQESFENSSEVAAKKKTIFVNAVKAIVRMGVEAIVSWNHLVGNTDHPLHITDKNKSEKAIGATYESLNKNQEFLKFVESGEFLELQENLFKKKEDESQQQLHVPSFSQSEDKKEYSLQKAITEFFDTEQGFHVRMKEVCDGFNEWLLEKPQDTLLKQNVRQYLEPYRKLLSNPFLTPVVAPDAGAGADVTHKKIRMIVDTMVTNRSEQKDNQSYSFTKEMQGIFDATSDASCNYNGFSQLIAEMRESPEIKKDPSLLEFLNRLSGELMIIPVQYGMRYELRLAEIKKNLSEGDVLKPIVANVEDMCKSEIRKSNSRILLDDSMPLYFLQKAFSDFEEKSDKLTSIKTAIQEIIEQGSRISDQARLQQVRDVLKLPYMDFYLEQRKKDFIIGVVKGEELRCVEKFFEDLKISSVAEMNKEGKTDERIMSWLHQDLPPDQSQALVQHLFDRAMKEGVIGGNEWIYVNARKAVNRMKGSATQKWNSIVEDKFKGRTAIIAVLRIIKTESEERDIRPSFSQLRSSVSDIRGVFELQSPPSSPSQK
jgi:hypothetical protein